MISEEAPLIEQYACHDTGYFPFIMRDGWQVAKLNYMPQQDVKAIHKLDKHNNTDEVFILLKGTAILIAAEEKGEGNFSFQCKRMEQGITYNIPKGIWHNIAMVESTELIIVEKDNTHVNDYEYFPLSDIQKNTLEKLIELSLDNG